MLVADALNVVLAVAVAQHGRALDCLHCGDLAAVALLEVVAGSDGSGGAGRRYEGREATAGTLRLQMREHALKRGARTMIVDQVVGKFRELIEYDVLLVTGELGAFVVDLLDIAFGARRAHDVGGIGD